MSVIESALPLGASGWRVWRWSCLRGAGFPAALVLRLAAATLPAAADAVLQAERDRAAAQAAAQDAITAAMAGMSGYDPAMRSALARVARFKQISQPDLLPPELHAPLAAYAAAEAAFQQAQARLAASAAEDALTWRAALRDVAQRPDLQQAMIWQNRHAFATSLQWLLDQPPAQTGSRVRAKERVLARYQQRYCVKNDTIGFFGPSVWASVEGGSPALALRPAQALVSRRSLHLENWGVDLLARAIEKQVDLRRWLAPRRAPLWYAEDGAAHFPFIAGLIRAGAPAAALRSVVPLDRAEQAALAACDGTALAGAIAAELAADPAAGLPDSAAAEALLSRLAERGLIEWALRIAPGLHPERDLRRTLERIDDPARRAAALAPLDELEQACQAVAAAGPPPQLAAALATVDAVFSRHTQQVATRAAGQAYAARTLIYEDCRRAVELTLGPAVLDGLAGPLELLAQSARWFTFTVAAAYRRSFEQIYRALAAQGESGWVDMLSFSRQALPLLQHGESPAVLAATAQFQARWADVLRLPEGSQAAEYRSADLAERVAAAFAAPHPGWPMAGYLAPDVLIAARSAEAAGQGDLQLVMGELHLYNTLAISCLVAQSPPEAQAELGDYLPPARVMAAAPAGQIVQRTAPVSLSPDDRFVLYSAAPGVDPRQSLPIGELGVEAVGQSLQVRTRDGRWQVDLLAFFDYLLVHQCRALPAPLALGRTPRVVIDGVTVWRAGWRFAAQDLLWSSAGDDADRMLAARRWSRQHGLPRWIYVRAPGEPKPLFIDLEAPISLQILGAAVEQAVRIAGPAAALGISEMLPAFDELWLADAADQRYTSELRMVMVDPCPWRPALLES
jgi:hypothetical protein